MALGATAGAIEILLTGLGVARLQIGDIDGPSIAFVRVRLGLRIVDERYDRCEIGVRERRRRHAFVSASGFENREDLVASHIFCNERGAREVGSRFTAHRVAAVAEPAVGGEKPLATLDKFRRICLRRDRLGRPLRGRTLLDGTSSPLAGRSLPTRAASRWRGRRLCVKERDNENREKQRNCAARCETQTSKSGIHRLVEVYVLPP